MVRGNVVMEGYYHDPEATAQAMGDGWFHTGDAAVVHPDGYVEIRDRIKDVIISGGENISSIEVEGTLLRHPAVQEAAIVGLPDEKWGETPHAFVVLKDGETATEAEIIAFTAGPAGALQGAARGDVRHRTAEDRDRQDPEVRAPRGRTEPGPPVAVSPGRELPGQAANWRNPDAMAATVSPPRTRSYMNCWAASSSSGSASGQPFMPRKNQVAFQVSRLFPSTSA